MELLIFGTGICVHGLTPVRRSPPGFLVTWGSNRTTKGLSREHLFIEYPGGSTERLSQYGMKATDIRNIFFSHVHPDHFCAAELAQARVATPDWDPDQRTFHNLDVFCNPSVETAFREIIKIQLPQAPPSFVQDSRIAFHTNEDGEYGLEKATLTMVPVFHSQGKTDCHGLRLEAPDGKVFAYSGDTAIHPNVVRLALGADIFLCEISARVGDVKSADKYGHLTPQQAGRVARQAGVKNLVFFHFSGQDYERAMIADCRESGYEGPISIPFDGKVISF